MFLLVYDLFTLALKRLSVLWCERLTVCYRECERPNAGSEYSTPLGPMLENGSFCPPTTLWEFARFHLLD
jgi:hypothetical protein